MGSGFFIDVQLYAAAFTASSPLHSHRIYLADLYQDPRLPPSLLTPSKPSFPCYIYAPHIDSRHNHHSSHRRVDRGALTFTYTSPTPRSTPKKNFRLISSSLTHTSKNQYKKIFSRDSNILETDRRDPSSIKPRLI